MKKRLFNLSLVALLAAPSLFAVQITEREALEAAMQFGANTSMKRAPMVSSSLTLAHTAVQAGEVRYYAFNRGNDNGYVIVAGDDCVEPILGYADSGSFDYDNMPDNMRWWLSEYEREIAYAASHQSVSAPAKAADTNRTAISPLLTTHWNQDAPYSNLCPTLSSGAKAATGCVATAAAQIMKKFNYPTKGTGKNSYTTYTLRKSLSADFGNTTYEWDKMLPSYGADATDAQNNAVATLMYHVGVSVNMDYNDQSGAQSSAVPGALKKYFGYDAAMQYLERNCYEYAEWFDIIYKELSEGRPVYYSGSTYVGSQLLGHAYVCDGYDGKGMFHINWGWGGTSNGYFKLTALNPGQIGIGGAEGGFNFTQDIIVGIQPAKDGSKVIPQMIGTGSFRATSTSVTRGSSAKFDFTNKYCVNYSIESRTLTVGVKIVSQADNSVTYVNDPSRSNSLCGMIQGFDNFATPTTNYPTANGKYWVYPAFKDSEETEWRDMKLPVYARKRVEMEINGNNITFTNVDYQQTNLVVEYAKVSKLVAGMMYRVEVNITNPNDNDFYESTQVCFRKKGETNIIANRSDRVNLNVEGQSSLAASFVGTLTDYEPGEYEMFLRTTTGIDLGAVQMVTIEAKSENEPTITVTKKPSVASEVNGITPIDDIRITFKLKNKTTGSFYTGNVTALIFETDGSSQYNVGNLNKQLLFVEGGEVQEVTLSGSFYSGVVGKTYQAVLYYEDSEGDLKMLTPSNMITARFTLGEESTSGIEGVTATDDSEVLGVEVFDAQGRLVLSGGADASIESLPAGLYIVRTHTANGVKVNKIVK